MRSFASVFPTEGAPQGTVVIYRVIIFLTVIAAFAASAFA
jgi:hypothetical protein